MFVKKSTEETPLDKVIREATEWLDPNRDDYMKSIEALERLHKLKQKEAESKVSPDTLALIAGNLLGILLILNHERAHIVTSKALSFVLKMR
jgi:hypothetical protein